MYTLTQFKTRVGEILQDDAGKLTATEIANNLQEALKTYSKHRPRTIIKEITGDGTYDYSITTHLIAWIKGFSIIESIEFPANEQTPEYLDDNAWMILEKQIGEYIRFLEDTPSATETIRVAYTALHILIDATVTISIATPGVVSYVDHKLEAGTPIKFATTGALPTGLTAGVTYYVIIAGLTANAFEVSATPGGAAVNTSGTQSGVQSVQVNTIPASDEDAVANLAASLCSGALASAYAQTGDSTITADSVDHKSKSEQYAARAREQKKVYLNHIGIKEGESEVSPASVVKDLDVDYPWGGDRLTHPKKWR